MKKIISFLLSLTMLLSLSAIISTTGLEPSLSVGVAFAVTAVHSFVAPMFHGVALVTVCGEISASILKSCTTPIQGGTRDRAVIMNFDDILSYSYAADGETITDIVLASGAVAYQIDGKNNSIAPKASLIKVGFNKMFDHTVMAKGFDISPAIKSQLNSMKDGRFVIITENYFKGTSGNSAFEVYGATSGLELTVIERDPNNADTQGAFDFTFFTDVNKEPRLPNALFITSYAASKAIVDALL